MAKNHAQTPAHRDCHRNAVAKGDRVMVTAYGYGARLVDCGTVSTVLRLTPTKIEIFDTDNCRRIVAPWCVRVLS